MRKWTLIVTVAAAMLLVAQAAPVVVRIAVNPAVGATQRLTVDVRSVAKLSLAGKSDNGGHTDHTVIEETLLRRDGSNATLRLRVLQGDREDETGHHVDARVGKTITVTIRGEKVGVLSSDGQPLPQAALDSTTKEMHDLMRLAANNVCTPATPLAVGATWNIAHEDSEPCFGPGRGAYTRASGTLSSVEGDFATIDYRYASQTPTLGSIALDAPSTVEGTMRIRVSLKEPLRWTETQTWHFAGSMHPRGPSGPAATADIRWTETSHSEPADVASRPNG